MAAIAARAAFLARCAAMNLAMRSLACRRLRASIASGIGGPGVVDGLGVLGGEVSRGAGTPGALAVGEKGLVRSTGAASSSSSESCAGIRRKKLIRDFRKGCHVFDRWLLGQTMTGLDKPCSWTCHFACWEVKSLVGIGTTPLGSLTCTNADLAIVRLVGKGKERLGYESVA